MTLKTRTISIINPYHHYSGLMNASNNDVMIDEQWPIVLEAPVPMVLDHGGQQKKPSSYSNPGWPKDRKGVQINCLAPWLVWCSSNLAKTYWHLEPRKNINLSLSLSVAH